MTTSSSEPSVAGTHDDDPSGATWSIVGRFDAHETAAFRERFDAFVGNGGRSLHVVLKDTNFIDSSALAELVRSMKQLRMLGGDVTLVEPSAPTMVILELTRLDKAFTIVRGTAS